MLETKMQGKKLYVHNIHDGFIVIDNIWNSMLVCTKTSQEIMS